MICSLCGRPVPHTPGATPDPDLTCGTPECVRERWAWTAEWEDFDDGSDGGRRSDATGRL